MIRPEQVQNEHHADHSCKQFRHSRIYPDLQHDETQQDALNQAGMITLLPILRYAGFAAVQWMLATISATRDEDRCTERIPAFVHYR